MNNRTNKIFVAIYNNEVVCLDNTLTNFHTKFLKIEKACPGYLTLFRRFKAVKDDVVQNFTLTLSGKEYHFQKLV